MLPQQLPTWSNVVRHHAIPSADAYGIAIAADRVRAPQQTIGYRLYWMKKGFLASREVPATPDGYVVIGRHTECDVMIEDERAVSLRHVIVRCTSTDDGAPILSVLDLRTDDGFELSDATKQHSIAATGPVVFRIGIHAVVALPSTGYPDELPTPIVDREEQRMLGAPKPKLQGVVQIVPSVAAPSKPTSQIIGPSRPVSHITLMPESVDLSRRRSVWSGQPAPVSAGPGGEQYLYELALEPAAHARRTAVVRFTGADLDHGVLIGRDDKCLDEGIRAILCLNISRVHVLLVRDRGPASSRGSGQGVCRLYDIASTNGTFVGNQRVRCVSLAGDGSTTTVSLMHSGGATLHWRSLVTLQ